MLQQNPLRMDYFRKYQEIVADYNLEKDRGTIEATFAQLMALYDSLDEEEQRHVREGLSEPELTLYDLLSGEKKLTNAQRDQLKSASRSLLMEISRVLATTGQWLETQQTQAEVETAILDHLFGVLPTPPFDDEDKQRVARRIYNHVASGYGSPASV